MRTGVRFPPPPPILKPQLLSVGAFSCLFAPVPACCWGFLRTPADFASRPNWPFPATFHSLLAIPRSDLAPWNWPEVRVASPDDLPPFPGARCPRWIHEAHPTKQCRYGPCGSMHSLCGLAVWRHLFASCSEDIHLGFKAFPQTQIVRPHLEPPPRLLVEVQSSPDLDDPTVIQTDFAVMDVWVEFHL